MRPIQKGLLVVSAFFFVATLFLSSASVVSAQYMVCDDGDACYKQWGYSWRYYKYLATCGGDYYYLSHWSNGTPRLGIAKWEKRIPASGTYEVKVSYRAGGNRGSATYYVTTGSTPSNMSLLQRKENQKGGCAPGSEGCGGCEEFVIYRGNYTEGQKAYVVLDGTDSNDSDSADAVSWRCVGGGCTVSPEEDLCRI